METYRTDKSQKLIKIQIHAGVVGVAETRVYLRYPGQNFKRILKSKPFSGGNIEPSNVDVNNNLLKATLKIETSMSLENVPIKHRPAAVATIMMVYTLTGGPDGNQSIMGNKSEIWVNDKVNPMDIEITKRIRLV